MKKIGIITVRDHQYHPNRRLLEAGTALGYPVRLIHPYKIWPVLGPSGADFVGQQAADLPEVVLPRQGSEISSACLTLVRHLDQHGIVVVNRAAAISRSRDQFITLQHLVRAGVSVPDTVLVNDADGLTAAVAHLGGFPVVVKQVRGRQGSGVFLVPDMPALRAIGKEHLDRYFGLLVQRFISPDDRTDIRVLVIGQAVVCAMALRPAKDDFRSNFHLSGQGRPITLTTEQQAIAIASAQIIGLEIAGVDLMAGRKTGPLVVEVNDSPGFRGVEAVTGIDVAARIIEYAAERSAT